MPARSYKLGAADLPALPRLFRGDKRRLSFDEARSLVGRWLVFCRQLRASHAGTIPTPPLVKQAYLVNNRHRDLPEATRQSMTAAARAVTSRPGRSLLVRLQPLLDRKHLPDDARIVVNTVRPSNRPPTSTAWLEIPVPGHPHYVTRYKASYSKAYAATAYTVRGHGPKPPGPKLHPWRPLRPAEIPALPAIAQEFIQAVQGTRSDV